MHLRIDAVARGIGENFEEFVESLFFDVGDVGALRKTLPFLDDDFEKVLLSRINIDLAAQLRCFESA